MSVALHCWSPLFPSPPTVDLPTQASRGPGCLEEEHINTLEHVNSSLYAVCKTYIENGLLFLKCVSWELEDKKLCIKM